MRKRKREFEFVVRCFVVSWLFGCFVIWLFDLFDVYFTPAVPFKVIFFSPRHVDVAEWWGRGQIEWVDPMQCVYFFSESGIWVKLDER